MPQQPPLTMPKPIYSLEAPDRRRLSLARIEIELILRKHDLASVVVLHTPGRAEVFHSLGPSYSVCSIDEERSALRIRSDLERDHGGDRNRKRFDEAATVDMAARMADLLRIAADRFARLHTKLDAALGAARMVPAEQQEQAS